MQLDRARSPHDLARLLDTNDVAYRLFLRAKLKRHADLAVEDEKRAKQNTGG